MTKFVLFILLLAGAAWYLHNTTDLFASGESSKTIWHRKYKKILKRNPVSVGKRVDHLLRADAEHHLSQQKIKRETADLQNRLSATDFECRIARFLREGDILPDQLDRFYPEARTDVVISLAEQYSRETEILSQKAPTAIHVDDVLSTQRTIDDLTDRILQNEAHLIKKEPFDYNLVLNQKLDAEKRKLHSLLKVSIGLNASNAEIVDCYYRARRLFLTRSLVYLFGFVRRLRLNSFQKTVYNRVMQRIRLYETVFPHPTGYSLRVLAREDLIDFLRKNKDPAYWVRHTYNVECEHYDLRKITCAATFAILSFEFGDTHSRYGGSQINKELSAFEAHLSACYKELQLLGIAPDETESEEKYDTDFFDDSAPVPMESESASASTSNTNQTYLMETWNGMLVWIPEDKLDAFEANQARLAQQAAEKAAASAPPPAIQSNEDKSPLDTLLPAHRAVYEAAIAELPEDPALRSALHARLTDGIQQIDDLTDYMGGDFPTATIALALYLDALTMEYTASDNVALQPLITRYDRAVRAAGVVGEEEYEHYMDTVCTWYDRRTERS